MNTNAIGLTEWERDFDPITEQPMPSPPPPIERHPGPFRGPDAELARACAMAVIPYFGTDDPLVHARILSQGVWNDHVAVQSALAAIRHIRLHGLPPHNGE